MSDLTILPPAALRAKLDDLDERARVVGKAGMGWLRWAPELSADVAALVALARKLLDEREAGIIRFEEDERIVQVHRGNGVWQRFVSKDQYNIVRSERDAAVAERDAAATEIERLKGAVFQAAVNGGDAALTGKAGG